MNAVAFFTLLITGLPRWNIFSAWKLWLKRSSDDPTVILNFRGGVELTRQLGSIVLSSICWIFIPVVTGHRWRGRGCFCGHNGWVCKFSEDASQKKLGVEYVCLVG